MRMARRTGILLAALAGSCGDDVGGPGTLRVDLVAEVTITEGLKAGPDEEDTRDYSVTYSKFLVAVGHVKLARTGSGAQRSDPSGYIADLRAIGTTGLTMTTFEDLPSGQWDQFGYETPVAAVGFQKLGPVSDADVQAMIDQQLTYWIEGTVQSPKPVNFVFKVPVGSQFSECERDGEPGVAVGEGRTTTAALTIHGDHVWFDTVVRGDEATVNRRTSWLVKSDKDGDGMVTSDDLKSVKAEDVFPTSEGYNLSGASIATAYDFLRAQLASQGHLDGEGECVTTTL
ncbi:MAG TPA: hypothetical protein VI299_03595 [Polyangiales bacterium]